LTEKNHTLLPEEEYRLLLSVAAGDQQAFHLLVDMYWRRVYGNTLTLVKSPAIAQEITQDIFLKIWKQRERLIEVRSFAQYIYVVGRNQVISAMRKKLTETTTLPEDIPEERFVPDQQLQSKETYRLIMDGVTQLTRQQQMVFTMSRIEGLSHEEIAQQLQLSKNTVKGHIVLALNFLRNYVRQHLGPMIITYLTYLFLLNK
jgi:RNA polymerase sigma-19 factor, ECF subfamily